MNERYYLSILIGGSLGGVLLTGTGAHTTNADMIVVNADATFTELEIGGADAMTARNYASVAIKQGTIIGPGLNYNSAGRVKITKVTLASGSVMAY